MKNAIALLVVFVLFGFSSNVDYKLSLKVVKIKSLDEGAYDVGLELYNDSGQKISFLSMYCSDSGFYVTDNENVKVIPKPCDKNFPEKVIILRNKYRTGNLQLQLAKNSKEAKFRIGFKFIEIPESISLIKFDSTTVKSVTIWSNPVEFKTH